MSDILKSPSDPRVSVCVWRVCLCVKKVEVIAADIQYMHSAHVSGTSIGPLYIVYLWYGISVICQCG